MFRSWGTVRSRCGGLVRGFTFPLIAKCAMNGALGWFGLVGEGKSNGKYSDSGFARMTASMPWVVWDVKSLL